MSKNTRVTACCTLPTLPSEDTGAIAQGNRRITIFLSQPCDEFLGRDHANLLLLGGYAVEEVCQAREKILLFSGLVLVS